MSTGQTPTRGRVAWDVFCYAAVRAALVVALSAVIYELMRLLGHQFPLIVAVLMALVVAMPLGMWLFSPLRLRATAGMASLNETRRRDRARLRARLHGDEETATATGTAAEVSADAPDQPAAESPADSPG